MSRIVFDPCVEVEGIGNLALIMTKAARAKDVELVCVLVFDRKTTKQDYEIRDLMENKFRAVQIGRNKEDGLMIIFNHYIKGVPLEFAYEKILAQVAEEIQELFQS